jgi:hypothetical protein
MAFTFFLISLATVSSLSQTKKTPPVCGVAAFTAFRQFPKLEYECPLDTTESDDKILKRAPGPEFSAYLASPDDRGIDANGRKIQRVVYRWNGRYYTGLSR